MSEKTYIQNSFMVLKKSKQKYCGKYVAGVVGAPIGKNKILYETLPRESCQIASVHGVGGWCLLFANLIFGSIITLIYILMHSFNNNYLSFKSIVPAKPPKPFYNPTCLVTKYCIFFYHHDDTFLALGPRVAQ